MKLRETQYRATFQSCTSHFSVCLYDVICLGQWQFWEDIMELHPVDINTVVSVLPTLHLYYPHYSCEYKLSCYNII